jgi:hypothetical protein
MMTWGNYSEKNKKMKKKKDQIRNQIPFCVEEELKTEKKTLG